MKERMKQIFPLIAIPLIATLILIAALSGCGGGGSGVAPAHATGGAVEGYVYVASYNAARSASAAPSGYEGLPGATVTITTATVTATTTDSDGYFKLTDVPEGSQTVQVTKTGYSDVTFAVDVVAGSTTDANSSASDSKLTMSPATTGSLAITATANCPAPVKFTADVYIDDKKTAYSTSGSLTISDLTASATYNVNLDADDDNFTRPATQTVTIIKDSTLSLAFTLTPLGNPFVTIASPADGSTGNDEGSVSFSGSAFDCEDGPLSGSSLVWTSSIDGEIGTGESFTKDDLSKGAHTITLTATDSDGYVDAATVGVTVTSNSTPNAYIAIPVDGTSYAEGSTVAFYGTGNDSEDGTLQGSALAWTSSLDGDIGTGSAFNKTNLSLGAHNITLTVTDSGGRTDTHTIAVTIITSDNSIPIATVTTPPDNSYYHVGTEISFSGTGVDAQDGNLSGNSLSWFSNNDGFLGSGALLQTDGLTLATHTISLTAMDSDGLSNTDTVTVVVVEQGTDLPPTVVITTPVDGTSITEGVNIAFTGAASDNEDGALTATLEWTSSADGIIGTGTAFFKNDLSLGAHTITLTATDSTGHVGSSSVSITITEPSGSNTEPTAVITTPIDGTSVEQGTTVIFTGAGADTEDGALTGGSLVWTSNVDGNLGTGTNFSKNDLSTGVHTITLAVTDSGALTDSTTVTLTIEASGGNNAPVPVIVLPISGSSVSEGAIVNFVGSAADPEDGALTGSSLAWSSSIDGSIGTGTNFTKNDLSAGAHTISLAATDGDGLTATATVSLTVE